MKIKVDEDLPLAVTSTLRAAGYEASSVHEQGMGGWSDGRLWRAIQTESRFLVTADKGFADVRTHPPGTHAGVLLLRPDKDGIGPCLRLIQEILGVTDLRKLAGSLAIASPSGLRVRKPEQDPE